MSFAETKIKEWRALPPESKSELYEVVQFVSSVSRAVTAKERQQQVEVGYAMEDEVERLLAEQGVISLPTEQPASERPEPIRVTGKPISETIVEERR